VKARILNSGGSEVATDTLTLAGDGKFTTTTKVGPGTYSVLVRGLHWCSARADGIVIVSSDYTIPSTFNLVNGDIDGDDYIGASDFAIWNAVYDKAEGDPGYDARADLDGDQYIGASDFAIWSANYDQGNAEFTW
jgi:hypothetical protein